MVKDVLVQQKLEIVFAEKKPDAIKDDEWMEMQQMAVSTIRLALAPGLKYDVLNETSPTSLMQKLEGMYMSKSITNKLCLKKQLYGLKMKEGTTLVAHLNEFNKLVTQLESIGEKIKEEDRAIILINSLSRFYEPVVTPLMVGRETLKMEDVTSVLLEHDRMRKFDEKVEDNIALVVEQGRSSWRGRNEFKGRNESRGRSGSRPRKDWSKTECWYCHELGHIKFYCPMLKEDMEDFLKIKKEKNKGVANVVEDDKSEDDEVLMVQECEKKNPDDVWVLDSACSEHVCSKREWFTKFEACDRPIYLANDEEERIEGIGNVKIQLHDGSVKTLGDVRYVPKFKRNLILLGRLDSKGYGYSAQGGGLRISKDSLVVMKGVKNSKNLYELVGSMIVKGEPKKDLVDVKFPASKNVRFADLVKRWR